MEQQALHTPLNILVVDDEANIRKTLAIGLEADGHHVIAVSNPADAIAENSRRSFDLAFVDLRLGAAHGMDLIPSLMAESPWLRIVIITAHGTIDSAVEAMKRGASDYLTKPFTPAQVKVITDREAQLRALQIKVAGLVENFAEADAALKLESANPAMQRAINLARQVADTDANVLIRGESGTGKGVLAKAIHAWSKRSARALATVSCPSLSSQLLESELFGHARGAFTGAVRDNPGRIAAASGGTLFLDEIGDLPTELQPKLLRFVQDKEFERVGDSTPRHADVRIISATNVDLDDAVKAKRFREDLLFRLNVVQIHVPPLRERTEDLIPLAETILRAHRESRNITGFTNDALAAIRGYAWPGNVRELRNAIEHAVIFCRAEKIGVEHFPANLAPRPAAIQIGDSVSIDQIEEIHIRRVLASSKSLDEAAEILGIDLATLWRRRRKYQI
ncbi:MAG TPA: sigma-54 dependent transcriptional regulator [Tepidisphaeraceae bacterium]|nr:sigma-54 dependent transcriptional regulator [Tepidisphaeraceae bacterium]